MSDVQQIKDAVDIIDLIGERVELKRSGKNWRGLCPFHSEHSPSFFVSDEIQRYKCFGCGASGDVFEFLEQYEGMSFREALEMLAQRTGIELKDNYSGPSGDERELLYEVMEAATKYYNYLLTDHEVGEVGRTYIEDRGISDRLIERYQLGYAMDSWDGIVKYLVDKKKYSIDLLKKPVYW